MRVLLFFLRLAAYVFGRTLRLYRRWYYNILIVHLIGGKYENSYIAYRFVLCFINCIYTYVLF